MLEKAREGWDGGLLKWGGAGVGVGADGGEVEKPLEL